MDDFKQEIIELAKAKGLNIAEDAVHNLVNLAVEVLELVIKKTENPYDDMIFIAVKGKVIEALNDLVDKIDGEVG